MLFGIFRDLRVLEAFLGSEVTSALLVGLAEMEQMERKAKEYEHSIVEFLLLCLTFSF